MPVTQLELLKKELNENLYFELQNLVLIYPI